MLIKKAVGIFLLLSTSIGFAIDQSSTSTANAVIQKFVTAYQGRDAMQLANLYEPDGIVIGKNNIIRGRTQIKRHLQQDFVNIQNVSMTANPVLINEKDNLIVATYSLTETVQTTNKQSFKQTVRLKVALKKEINGWLILKSQSAPLTKRMTGESAPILNS